VREDVDPHLPATADVPGHGDTRRLDLAVGHVGLLQRLDAVLTEVHTSAALGHAAAAGPVLLAVLDPTRDQHVSLPPLAVRPARPRGRPARPPRSWPGARTGHGAARDAAGRDARHGPGARHGHRR